MFCRFSLGNHAFVVSTVLFCVVLSFRMSPVEHHAGRFQMAASKAIKFTYNNTAVNWMRKFAWNHLWGGLCLCCIEELHYQSFSNFEASDATRKLSCLEQTKKSRVNVEFALGPIEKFSIIG